MASLIYINHLAAGDRPCLQRTDSCRTASPWISDPRRALIVTAGCGWVQRDGGLIEEVRPGDVVWFPPDEKHWHGASPTTAMTHIAIQEGLDGKVVDWMEKVSDEQYKR
jgi:quercetin dioxygenase-like cupin family protein